MYLFIALQTIHVSISSADLIAIMIGGFGSSMQFMLQLAQSDNV